MSAARAKLEAALARIADLSGEGERAFRRVWPRRARAAADAADALADAGADRSPLAGRIVSIKDLFDIKGEPTTAGSVVLCDASPAISDAPVVVRLAAAGAIIIGKTNMTEFAYSGVGINPHYGTPGNPYDRARIPGGSSSGAAVAVADGMCEIAIGSDTGGSVRLPAALCGIVGFKPTARRVPTTGALPLSTTLDSIGPLAKTVADCAIADAVMAGEPLPPTMPFSLDGARLLLPTTTVLDGLDDAVGADFARALTRLSDAGARIVEGKMELFESMAEANSGGGFAAAESYAWHRELLEKRAEEYDPRVRARIERGRNMSAADYIALCKTRVELVAAFDAAMEPFDAAIMPTAAIVAPEIAAFAGDDQFTRLNLLLLRNTMIGNFFDLCGISLPMSPAGAPPTGLMLLGRHGADRRLLRLAAAVETTRSS